MEHQHSHFLCDIFFEQVKGHIWMRVINTPPKPTMTWIQMTWIQMSITRVKTSMTRVKPCTILRQLFLVCQSNGYTPTVYSGELSPHWKNPQLCCKPSQRPRCTYLPLAVLYSLFVCRSFAFLGQCWGNLYSGFRSFAKLGTQKFLFRISASN